MRRFQLSLPSWDACVSSTLGLRGSLGTSSTGWDPTWSEDSPGRPDLDSPFYVLLLVQSETFHMHSNYSWPLDNTGVRAADPRAVKNPSTYNFTVSPPYLQFHVHGFNQPQIVEYYSMYLLTKKVLVEADLCSSNLCCSKVSRITSNSASFPWNEWSMVKCQPFIPFNCCVSEFSLTHQ